MGSRGAFIDINNRNFNFVQNGQQYFSLPYDIDNIKVIVKNGKGVKAPEYSHTENRVYVIMQKGNIKTIAFYDEYHKQIKAIDFTHPHGYNKVQPHVHFNMEHVKDEAGTPPSDEDWELIKLIQRKVK